MMGSGIQLRSVAALGDAGRTAEQAEAGRGAAEHGEVQHGAAGFP